MSLSRFASSMTIFVWLAFICSVGAGVNAAQFFCWKHKFCVIYTGGKLRGVPLNHHAFIELVRMSHQMPSLIGGVSVRDTSRQVRGAVCLHFSPDDRESGTVCSAFSTRRPWTVCIVFFSHFRSMSWPQFSPPFLTWRHALALFGFQCHMCLYFDSAN